MRCPQCGQEATTVVNHARQWLRAQCSHCGWADGGPLSRDLTTQTIDASPAPAPADAPKQETWRDRPPLF